MKVADLATPCAVVDLERLERNTTRMARRASQLGVRLRPHVKTHKCAEVAKLQVRGHFGGLTVSSLAEARACAAGGFTDLTWAVPVTHDRLPEAADLAAGGVRLGLLVDHPDSLEVVIDVATRRGVFFPVWLKINSGGDRAGLEPDDRRLAKLAKRAMTAAAVKLAGLLTHAGQAYGGRSPDEVRVIAEHERATMVECSAALRGAGVDIAEVSIGSTPAMTVVDDLKGITEVRPGNYVFFDVTQMALGSCSVDDVAFSVMTSVVGCYPGRSELVLNAGALALSKDPGPLHLDPDCGFGLPVSLEGRVIDGLTVVGLSQEHGVVRVAPDLETAAFPVGSKMRILPNHSCLSAACFDRYHVVRGDRVVDLWRPASGW